MGSVCVCINVCVCVYINYLNSLHKYIIHMYRNIHRYVYSCQKQTGFEVHLTLGVFISGKYTHCKKQTLEKSE